jgi:16S rRNA (cytosine1402-N4)-methyltransferase
MPDHVPVLIEEVLGFLGPDVGQLFIDATLGAGGHAEALLSRTAPSGRLLGIDQDDDALELATARLARFGPRAVIRQSSFDTIGELAPGEGFGEVHGILADLGVSSMMLDRPERGFSFQSNGPLDMRMDRRQPTTAADLVNHMNEKELANLIFEYGEERRSRPIARSIVRKRPYATTGRLVEAIEAVTGPKRHGQIHPATRTFMSLRIAVNDEIGKLRRFLSTAPGLLVPGGRLAVISFHSIEDRIVKNAMREYGGVLTKKVVTAGDPERRSNPRARSAKLRVLEKN